MSHDIHAVDNAVDDFDLFWGMGPRSDQDKPQQQHKHNTGPGEIGGNIGEISKSSAPSVSTLGGNSSLDGSSSMSSTTATLMGSLWSHGGAHHLIEDYGHRHHVHGVVTGLQNVGAGSTPSPVRSRRPVWLSPPGQHHQNLTSGASRSGGVREAGNHLGQHHHNPASPPHAAVDAVSTPRDDPSGSNASQPPSSILPSEPRVRDFYLNGGNGSSNDSNVACKLEELAAAITSSVMKKLDTGVMEALSTAQQHQQPGGGVSFVAPRFSTVSASVGGPAVADEGNQRRTEVQAAIAAALGPLHSRLAGLEAQVSQLTSTAALDRSCRSTTGGGGGSDTRKSGRGGSGGSGGNVLGHAWGSGGGTEAETLLALNALAQRTGTLEGRHKQVQAKVALLDNAFGPKASDWAQTFKSFLQEKEAAAGGAPRKGAGKSAALRSAGGGGGGKGGKRTLAIDAPVFSPQAAQKGNGTASAENGTTTAPAGPIACSRVGSAVKPQESTPEIANVSRGGGRTSATPATVPEEAAGAGRKGADRCAACLEVQERCTRLETRVAESEKSLSLMKSNTLTATAATAYVAKEGEVVEDRKDAAVGKAPSSSGAVGTQPKATASAGAAAGNNWASKTSIEKLSGELKHLSVRVKDGEDAVALVDHGLKGVRDEIAPMVGSVMALKKLVEAQLREKEQAAELLKGYVTTITREVATTTRQYINGLLAPAAIAATGTGDAVQQNSQPAASSTAGSGEPGTVKVDKVAPPVVDGVRARDGIPLVSDVD